MKKEAPLWRQTAWAAHLGRSNGLGLGLSLSGVSDGRAEFDLLSHVSPASLRIKKRPSKPGAGIKMVVHAFRKQEVGSHHGREDRRDQQPKSNHRKEAEFRVAELAPRRGREDCANSATNWP